MAKSVVPQNPACFYVYEMIVDGLVRYIGKGVGPRHREHLRLCRKIVRERAAGKKVKATHFYNRLIAVMKRGGQIETSIMTAGLREGDALDLERRMIAAAAPGELWNTLPGGNGFDSAFIKALWADPETRANYCRQSADNWRNPEFRARQIVQRNDPGHRKRMSAALTQALSDPEVREKMRVAKKKTWADEAYRQRRNEAARRRWQEPELKAKQSASQRKRFADDAQREATRVAQTKVMADPENRRRLSEASRKLWLDPDYRERQTATRRTRRNANRVHDVEMGGEVQS